MSTIGLIGRMPAACSRAVIQAGEAPTRHVGDRRRVPRAQLRLVDRHGQLVGLAGRQRRQRDRRAGLGDGSVSGRS